MAKMNCIVKHRPVASILILLFAYATGMVTEETDYATANLIGLILGFSGQLLVNSILESSLHFNFWPMIEGPDQLNPTS